MKDDQATERRGDGSVLRRRGRSAAAYVIAAVLIGCAALWVVRHWDRVEAVFSLSPGYLAVLLPLTVLSFLTVGLLNQVVAGHLGARLRFLQWASLAFAAFLANYVLPARAGLAVRAAYYKRIKCFPISSFVSAMAVVYVTTLLVACVICIGALTWLWRVEGLVCRPLFLGAAVAAALCVAVLVLSGRASQRPARPGIWEAFTRIRAGWDMLIRSPGLMICVAGLCIAVAGMGALRLGIAFAATGHRVGVAGCLLLASLVSLSTFISITPAGLGIREAVLVFSSMAIGVPPEQSLIAGATLRAVNILIVFTLGPISAARISREAARGPDGPDSPGIRGDGVE